MRDEKVVQAAVGAPLRQSVGARLLTLPFTDPRITVSQGWIYDWGSQHGGTDYMLGDRNTTNWQPFDVVAAADGWACGNCTSRQGNAIWIKHLVDGQTLYTYYGHLATIEPNIPMGDQHNTVWVQRGQKIGVSGSTGADVIHLHFQVNTSAGPIDPYDLWATREIYSPGCGACTMGPNNLWTTNPPSLASGDPIPTSEPSTPAPQPTATSVPRPPTATAIPTATATKVSTTLTLSKAVEGALSDGAPETRYFLTASAGDAVSIRMFSGKNSTLDTYLKLYGPDGSLIATDDDGAQVDSNSFLVAQLPVKGVYQVVATRFSGSGTYRLRADKGSKSALGDLNSDCVVNQSDIQTMSAALAQANAEPNSAADINLDGTVDAADQQIQQYRLGRGCMQVNGARVLR